MRVVVCVLWAILALAGCASRSVDVDTAGFETRLSAVPGVNGAMVEVQHPGLPTNTNVAIWLFLESADVESVATTVRKVAGTARSDDGVRGRQITISVVQGTRAEFPIRQDVVANSVPVMHRVAEALALPESAGLMLVLTPEEVARLADVED